MPAYIRPSTTGTAFVRTKAAKMHHAGAPPGHFPRGGARLDFALYLGAKKIPLRDGPKHRLQKVARCDILKPT